jgi:hypothetical protein
MVNYFALLRYSRKVGNSLPSRTFDVEAQDGDNPSRVLFNQGRISLPTCRPNILGEHSNFLTNYVHNEELLWLKKSQVRGMLDYFVTPLRCGFVVIVWSTAPGEL